MAIATANKIDTTYYDYLINMSLRNLTKERRNDILKEQQEKHEKLEALQRKAPEDLYEDDLHNFEAEYQKVIDPLIVFSSSIDRHLKFRLWKKNVLMKCLKLLITQLKKLLI
jgi:ribosome recycling factor